jgi:hypothetical protein
VQLNNFAYWDSTTSRFRQITAQAVVDSLVFSTRAWRKKGDDSLGAVIATRTDTTLLSTKAYRQKAVDSLVTLISTLGGGTVLSVSAGTGMNFTTITTSGSVSADTSVLSTRAWRKKGDDSLGAVIAGKVNISDTSTMLGAYLRKADTTAMLTPYLRKGDTTAMLSPYVRTAGFGLTKGTQTLSVDSALMATRARVQKGIDSVASLVTTTDSVVFSTRAWRQKGVDSVAALANTKATATGTTNYLSKFTGTSSLGNSIVYATTSEVGISTPSPTESLDVNGKVRIRTIDSSASPSNMLWTDATGVIRKTSVPSLAVDSVLFSTRAWRQKGDDSLAAIIATKGTGTVTSVGSGFGTNFSAITSTGSVVVDSAVMATRARVQKGIDSLGAVKGAGTVTSVATGFGLSGGTITSTGTLVADTNSMATRARVQKAVDSLQVNINAKGSGTVTSVAAGTGMSFTTITSTGSVSADTVALSTRAWRQKGIDSVQANVALKVNISDTATMLSPYIRAAGFGLTKSGQSLLADSATMATRARVQKGIDSVAALSRVTGSGTTNRMAKFTASGAVGNGSIADSSSSVRMYIASGGNVGIGAATIPDAQLHVQNSAGTHTQIWGFTGFLGSYSYMRLSRSTVDGAFQFGTAQLGFSDITFATSQSSAEEFAERMRIKSNGEILMGTTTDAGDYRLQVAGAITNTTGPNHLNVTSGNTGIGLATSVTPSEKLHVNGKVRIATIDSSASPINMLWADNNGVVRKAPVASGGITGTGITGYIPKWTGASSQDTSQVLQSNGNIGIGNSNPSVKLDVNGSIYSNNNIRFGATRQFEFTNNGDEAFQLVVRGNLNRRVLIVDTIGNLYSGFMINNQAGGATLVHKDGELKIGSTLDTGNFRLQVFGKAWIDSAITIKNIDSTTNAINMLYAGTDGVIRKAPVPASSVTMSTDNMTAASGWTIAYDKTQAYPVNDVNKTLDGSIATVTINTAAYRTTATFNTDQWVHVATVPAGFRPESDVYFSLPNTVAGGSFRSTSSVAFTSYNFYQEETAVRVLPNGNVEVYVGLVSNSADLSGANYVIMPIAVTYNIETYPN